MFSLTRHFPNLFKDRTPFSGNFSTCFGNIGGKKADTLVVLELAQALINIFIHSTNMYGVTALCHTLFKMLVIYTGNKPDKGLHLFKDYIIEENIIL